MKKLLFAALLVMPGLCHAKTVHQKSYVKKDGTYVAPSYKTSPNKTKADNYSTQGNVNPYTGKKGTKNPYGNLK